MKPTNHDLESISVRRANVADAEVVRYRVYKTPIDFVLVTADSALMAVKVSGVAKPYKIMRDLFLDRVSIDAQRMESGDKNSELVAIKSRSEEKTPQFCADLPEQEPLSETFVSLQISELQNKTTNQTRILSPDMVHEIIEDHVQKQAAPVLSPKPPVSEPPAPPELSVEEKMRKLAEEVLPSAADLDPSDLPPPDHREPLSPEEVKRLLNE